mgnify:CR=1 FL=1
MKTNRLLCWASLLPFLFLPAHAAQRIKDLSLLGTSNIINGATIYVDSGANLIVSSGGTLTIASGGSIVAASGSTVTGFGGGGGGGGTWGSITGTLSSQTDLNTALSLRATIASPTFTGTPAAPTAAADTNTTQIATTAFVIAQSYLKSATAASTYQPLDADLTSWAAVTRASGFDTFVATPSGANFASLLTTALPASKGGTGLTSLSANVVSLLGAADYSAMRTQLGLVIGTDVQPFDADLSALAALSGTNTIYYRSASNTWSAVTIGSNLTFSAGTLSASGSGGGLASTDIDTSAELRAILTDETGTGAAVFASDPLILTPNASMGALAVDVTKRVNTKSVSADSTLTFSGTPSTGFTFGLALTNSDTAAHTITIPSSYSLTRNAAITTFTLPASSTLELSWRYDGTTYFLSGDAFTINDLSTATPATGDKLPLYDVSAGSDANATVANVVLAGLPAFSGDATTSAGASVITLATVNSNVGTFGNATQTSAVTVNAKGLVTAASNVTVTPAIGSVTGLGTGVSTALVANANASGGFVTGNGSATLTNKTIAYGSNTITGLPDVWVIPIGDETTAITTGTAKVTFRAPYAATVTGVKATLTTVSSSGTPTFDINEGGTTILSTKLTVDASEKTSTTAATAAVISDNSLADDAEITIDVDTAGTSAAGAKIYIYVIR